MDDKSQTTSLNTFEQGILSADDLVRALLFLYSGASNGEVLSIGTWDVIEPDPARMTIHTLPRFQAGMRVTIGQLKGMQQ